MFLKGSFPIPVLGAHDDISGDLEVKCTVHKEPAATVIKVELEMSNAGIQSCIEDGSACYSVRLSCPKTYFRRSYMQPTPDFVLPVSNDEIAGTLVVSGRVTSTKNISKYRPSGLNADYGDSTFYVTPGQLLAFSSDYEVLLPEGFDPLRNPDASIMQISPNSDLSNDEPFRVDFESPKIQITISPQAFSNYGVVKQFIPNTLHMSLVVPVLAEAIRLMSLPGQGDDFADFKWHEVLSHYISANEIDINVCSPLELAQKILRSPHNKALGELEDVITSEPEE